MGYGNMPNCHLNYLNTIHFKIFAEIEEVEAAVVLFLMS